jgi:hypothetical protein
VGPFDAGGGEVIAYTVGHSPTLRGPFTWTPTTDTVAFSFDPKYRIRFQNWIVQGPFAAGQTKAVNACIVTSQIWRDERQGINFSAFAITDSTTSPSASAHLSFTCAKAATIKAGIGFDSSAVNIYWVSSVNTLQSNAVWCGDPPYNEPLVVAIGANATDHLFTHEVGHAFSLTHVNNLPSFDTENVMHPSSSNRKYLTEGQTFRAVLNSASAINTIGTRVGVTRNCPNSTSTTDPQCPALQRRVWADGAFPADP